MRSTSHRMTGRAQQGQRKIADIGSGSGRRSVRDRLPLTLA